MTTWYLYDDPAGKALRPLTWLRPASSLLLGSESIRERWEREVGLDQVQVVVRDELVPITERSMSRSEAVSRSDSDAIWVSDLLLPNRELVSTLRRVEVGSLAGRVVSRKGASPPGLADFAEGLDTHGEAIEGRSLEQLADLIALQESLLSEDLERILAEGRTTDGPGDGVAYDRASISIGPGCQVDHGAVLDAREGPIVLGPNVHVHPHTWVRGPFFAQGNAMLLGGRIGGGTSLGPECKIRGEVEASVFLGYDNKAHDGFVGHSYLGPWVNLGAMTTTSDLKNNYSNVTLSIAGTAIPTGSRKVGSILGDHVKTRIGCLLNTGTVVGVGASLFGDPAVAHKWIPDFAWGSGPNPSEYGLRQFLSTAEIVFGRRSVPWTDAMSAALTRVFEATKPDRDAWLESA